MTPADEVHVDSLSPSPAEDSDESVIRSESLKRNGTPAREMQRLIRSLPLPEPWDRQAFVRTVESLRGRAIRLMPVDNSILAESACGIWLIRESDDIVLYPEGTSEYHADQIILHELGHMILEHDKSAATGNPMFAALTNHLDCASVLAALGRSAYGTAAEHDAELFASLILSRRKHDAPHSIRDAFFGDR